MGKVERQFKGIWIPAHIWLNKNLSAIDKILLADIDSFTGNGKLFYKSNATLVSELGVSESTVKRAFKTLLAHNLIQVSGSTRKRYCEALNSFDDSGHLELYKGHKELGKGQDDPVLGSKRTTTNSVSNSVSSPLLSGGIVLPFNNELFAIAWIMWIDERKHRRYHKYTLVGEQAALHKLYKESDKDCSTAIAMINESVANGWRGIFPLKNQKNERTKNKGFDSAEYRDYLKTLS